MVPRYRVLVKLQKTRRRRFGGEEWVIAIPPNEGERTFTGLYTEDLSIAGKFMKKLKRLVELLEDE